MIVMVKGAAQGLDEVPLRLPLGQHVLQEAEEGRGRVGYGKRLLRRLGQLLEPVRNDGRKQRLFRREVAINGAGADLCPARNLVERHRETLARKCLLRRYQDALAVSPRIGTACGYGRLGNHQRNHARVSSR